MSTQHGSLPIIKLVISDKFVVVSAAVILSFSELDCPLYSLPAE